METPQTKPAPVPRKSFGTKQQQIFAFLGMVLFLTGLVATGLLGQFNIITIILCLLGIAIGSVVFLPRVTRNLSVYANMVLYSFFFCAAAIVFFMILQKHPLTYDATQNRSFSLSNVTSSFLQRLDQPIRATVFVRNKSDRMAAARLMGEYSRYSPQFEYQLVDPFQETAKAQRFSSEVLPGDVYLERLTTGTERQADRVVKVSKLTEEQVTNGIVQVLRGKELSLYFTAGHGEPALEEDKVSAALMNKPTDPDNLQSLADQLKRSYIRAVPLHLDRNDRVPVDASAVVIVRPRVDFQPGETRALREYLDRGGRVMFLLNPDMPQLGNEFRTALTNIGTLVKEFGIDLPPQVVVMPLAQQQGQSIYVTPIKANQTRVTQGLPTTDPFVNFAQTRPVVPGTPPPNTFMETFLETTDQSWPFPIEELQRALLTRTDPKVAPQVKDLKSIPVGVTSTRTRPGAGPESSGKVVVIGNGDFVTTRYFDDPQKWILFMNGINWLTDSGDLIAIPQTDLTSTPAELTPGQSRFIFILVVIAVPTLIALGGLGYSITRRGTLQ